MTFILTGSVQFHSCNQFVPKPTLIYEQQKYYCHFLLLTFPISNNTTTLLRLSVQLGFVACESENADIILLLCGQVYLRQNEPHFTHCSHKCDELNKNTECHLCWRLKWTNLKEKLTGLQSVLWLASLCRNPHELTKQPYRSITPILNRTLYCQHESSSSYVCHGVRPLVDPFRSHVSRCLLRGLPRFLLPVGE